MHRKSDGSLLKTKIVATLGRPRGGVCEPGGQPMNFRGRIDFWDQFMSWFFRGSMYLIDVVRLNMAFFSPPGENERQIIKWLRDNKSKTGNVALLGDLPGPKIRLSGLAGPTTLKLGQQVDLVLKGRPSEGDLYVSVGDRILARADPSVPRRLRAFLRRKRPLQIRIGDGQVVLRAVSLDHDRLLRCRVLKGGEIDGRPGVTLRQFDLQVEAFGRADREALDFLVDNALDFRRNPPGAGSDRNLLAFVALSFVKSADDICKVKRYAERRIAAGLRRAGAGVRAANLLKQARLLCPGIIAKIETAEACANINEILDVADGIMVARGDLALQLKPQRVPAWQKRLIRLCNLRGKPVITATEMLASMEKNDEPTRAESNDVFNAIQDGTDAVMLSAETSKGIYPFQSVEMMAAIAEEAEKYYENFGRSAPLQPGEKVRLNEQRFEDVHAGSVAVVRDATRRLQAAVRRANRAGRTGRRDRWLTGLLQEKLEHVRQQGITDGFSMSACILSNSDVDYAAILAPTTSGRTARMISRFRPDLKIIGAAHDEMNRRKLALSYGVYPLHAGTTSPRNGRTYTNPDDVRRDACTRAKREGYLRKGDTIIMVSGTPLFTPGATNMIQVREVD
jgi:pyruvate kinase